MDQGKSTARQAEWGRLRGAAEAELARRGLRRGFRPPLRALFDTEQATGRAQELATIFAAGAAVFVAAIVLFNLLMVTRPHWEDVWLQCTVAPFLALTIGYLTFRPETTPLVREGGALAASACFSIATVLAVCGFSGAVGTETPFLAAVPAVAVLCLVRLRWAAAIMFVGLLAASLWMILSARPDLPLAVRIHALGFLLAISLPALVAAHRADAAARDVFLRGLLQGLQIEQLALENSLLSQLSTTDVVTGAANRRQLDSALRLLCAEPPGNDFLLLADIDFFKRFNDRNGHLAGDACLRDVVAAMRFQLRRTDLVARFGGEEFAIVLARTTRADAMATAERIRTGVAAHGVVIDGRIERVTVSIGLAERLSGTTPGSLIALADGALYAAKRSGRNCVRCAVQAEAEIAA